MYKMHKQPYSGDNIERNEMGGAYISVGGGEKLVQGFGGKT
jgi:hypothetical protein